MASEKPHRDRTVIYVMAGVVAALLALVVMGILGNGLLTDRLWRAGGPAHFYQLPPVSFQISDPKGRRHFGRLVAGYELGSARDSAAVQGAEARIVAAVHRNLSRKSLNALRSKRAVWAIKAIMKNEAEKVGRRGIVKDVLIQELLIN